MVGQIARLPGRATRGVDEVITPPHPAHVAEWRSTAFTAVAELSLCWKRDRASRADLVIPASVPAAVDRTAAALPLRTAYRRTAGLTCADF